MINPYNFTQYPEVKILEKKDVISPNTVKPEIEIKVKWKGLLNMTDTEVERELLYESDKFKSYIEKIKKRFLKNPDRYPTMTDKDWK